MVKKKTRLDLNDMNTYIYVFMSKESYVKKNKCVSQRRWYTIAMHSMNWNHGPTFEQDLEL